MHMQCVEGRETCLLGAQDKEGCKNKRFGNCWRSSPRTFAQNSAAQRSEGGLTVVAVRQFGCASERVRIAVQNDQEISRMNWNNLPTWPRRYGYFGALQSRRISYNDSIRYSFAVFGVLMVTASTTLGWSSPASMVQSLT